MHNDMTAHFQGLQDKDKQNKKHNTICVECHYLQAKTNNVNKT